MANALAGEYLLPMHLVMTEPSGKRWFKYIHPCKRDRERLIPYPVEAPRRGGERGRILYRFCIQSETLLLIFLFLFPQFVLWHLRVRGPVYRSNQF